MYLVFGVNLMGSEKIGILFGLRLYTLYSWRMLLADDKRDKASTKRPLSLASPVLPFPQLSPKRVLLERPGLRLSIGDVSSETRALHVHKKRLLSLLQKRFSAWLR